MKILFTDRLLQLRKEASLNQSQLAEALGTTQRKISYWETGKTEPDLASLLLIAEYFNVTTDYLLGKTDY